MWLHTCARFHSISISITTHTPSRLKTSYTAQTHSPPFSSSSYSSRIWAFSSLTHDTVAVYWNFSTRLQQCYPPLHPSTFILKARTSRFAHTQNTTSPFFESLALTPNIISTNTVCIYVPCISRYIDTYKLLNAKKYSFIVNSWLSHIWRQ